MAALKPTKTRELGDVAGVVVLCATHRLARNLRLAHDRTQAAQGHLRWQPLPVLTVPQWLDKVCEEALLTGSLDIADVPGVVLTSAQERTLWEQVIRAETGDAPEAMFFDSEGLAATAMEANALMEGWDLRIGGDGGEDTRRFLRWRSEFRRRCEAAGWCEAVRAASKQIDALAGGAGSLPARVLFVGFDRYTRQEERLAQTLAARGCEVGELELGAQAEGAAVSVALADRNAECRAAVSWAAALLAEDPERRIGIVVPDLAALRNPLADALDEALHPQAFAAQHAEMPRRYNFSLGVALARQPLVEAALRLLRFAIARRIEQSEAGELLRAAYWSADESEADWRARLDARLRETLAPVFSVDRLMRFLNAKAPSSRLVAALGALREAASAQPSRQLPSQWAPALKKMLDAARWPGERTLTSHEFQAQAAFGEAVDSLAQFDGVLGRISASEAVSRLAQVCREKVFQPETANDPTLQVVGPLEAAGMQFDALWVMGMNDDTWPAAASPNPLLPADAQRHAGTPGASAEVEAAFALAIHCRLLRSAPQVTFSWAQGEGDRVRRASPLIVALSATEAPAVRQTLAASLRGQAALERLDDNLAPPLAEGEPVRGGASLLKAQAICPAWAYYRFRLGARALGEPVEGLDALARGSLLHAVLEAFWKERSSAQLAAMSPQEIIDALNVAIDTALASFNAERDEPLPTRIAALERERLLMLVGRWLEIEMARPVPFRVVACEEERVVNVEGLELKLTVDRIDELDDGRRVVIDYKTSRNLDVGSWAESRIIEPQLPLYAAWAEEGAVDAVAFARVRAGDEGFVGIAADGDMLPGVSALADKGGRRRFGEADFPDWTSLVAHWHRAIGEIASEVKDGVAAVVVQDEGALLHCEVKPLLRLAERRSQQESST